MQVYNYLFLIMHSIQRETLIVHYYNIIHSYYDIQYNIQYYHYIKHRFNILNITFLY